MSEVERLEREGDAQRKKNIAAAREAWRQLRAERTDEGAILRLLSVIEFAQYFATRSAPTSPRAPSPRRTR